MLIERKKERKKERGLMKSNQGTEKQKEKNEWMNLKKFFFFF